MEGQQSTSTLNNKIQSIRDTISVYWGALVSMFVTHDMTTIVRSGNIFSADSRKQLLTFLEDLLDRLLPPVNENDSSRRASEEMDEMQRVKRFFSTLLSRLHLHGGLYLIVLQTRVSQIKEDITTSSKMQSLLAHLNNVKEFVIVKVRDVSAYTSARVSSSIDSINAFKSCTTNYFSKTGSQIGERVSSFDLFPWSTLKIDDVAAWMSKNSSYIPTVKSQAELVIQRVVQAISQAVSQDDDTATNNNTECNKTGAQDSLSTSSTESCCTPANSDEANSAS